VGRLEGLVTDTAGDCRGGFALPGVVLALAVLLALAFMAAAVARREVVNAGVAVDLLAAEAGAAAAVEEGLRHAAGPSPAAVGGVLEGMARGALGPREWELSVYRLTREYHILVGYGDLAGAPARTRRGRLVWWLDPAERVTGFRAVVESGAGVLPTEAVAPVPDPLGPTGDHEACHGAEGLAGAAPNSLPGSGPLPPVPEWGGGEEDSGLRLGHLLPAVLVSRADRQVSGAVTLSGCSTCWQGLVVAEGGATLEGTGSGVLVVLGDLAQAPGSSWDGLVLAAGDVALAAGARVTGLIRAGGTVSVGGGALVEGSLCAAYRSLAAATSLRRPVRIPDASLLGPLPPLPG